MSTIRFVEAFNAYSLYVRADGEEVYLAHGFPRVYLVEYDESWMMEQWRGASREIDFLDWLRDHLVDPDIVDELSHCEDCGRPAHRDDGQLVDDEDFVCNDCAHRYCYKCADCQTLTREVTTTGHNENVCESCLESSYSFCEECDAYYHYDYSGDHEHNEECGCESPALNFAVRNDGEGMLSNDERAAVSLPAGTLDTEGVYCIQAYLQNQGMYQAARLAAELDRRWQTKEGNFTKRLSRSVYKKYGDKIPPTVLSQVGSIAKDHSKSIDFLVEVTRDLNMGAEAFYHEDSCWWQSYSAGRCALKSNGGFGLRSFDSRGRVSGRAWVMPLTHRLGELRPTFDTETPDAFVVFNCYGDLEGYAAARIISHMAGMTYRKVGFEASPMYVNGNSGYLVAPEEIASKFTDGQLSLHISQHSDLFASEEQSKKVLASVA